jgi:ribosomal protein S18 acetylase RimI-like enzyme
VSGVNDPVIRPYQLADRQDVFRIAADTAFFGEPVENFLEDRKLFCDLFYRYYTDFAGSVGFVACAGEDIVGFIIGSLDTRRQQHRLLVSLLPGVCQGVLARRYTIGAMTWRYAFGLLMSALRQEFAHCDLSVYPAHLHVNVDTHWRGQGLGRRLLAAYLTQLKSLGIPGVHLHTTNLNEAAIILYERLGFSLLEARRTRLWEDQVSRVVENRCYGLRLTKVE